MCDGEHNTALTLQAVGAYQYLALRISCTRRREHYFYPLHGRTIISTMTKYGEMSLEYKPRAKRNTYAVFVIVVIIAVAVAIVIGFFIGKSVGENASKSPSQTTVIPNYLDSSEFEALRKRVNEGVSTQRLRDNLK